ncbi:MAG TPA: PqqD family protein [Planctomycetota bacterium]|nr:PqqD family protein [Planctomycetota bacterium]
MPAEPSVPLPRRREGFLYQEVSDGGVLFDPVAEKMYVLNPSAAFIWNSLDGHRTKEGIVEDLREALGDSGPDGEALKRDVERSLSDFARQGLLES